MRSPVSRNPEVVRARILDAAQAEFMAEGFAGASTNRILERFGGSKPTMFRHFETKRALFEAVVARIAERWRDAVDMADVSDADPRAWLERFAERALRWILTDESIFVGRMAIAEGHLFPEVGETYRQHAVTPLNDLLGAQLAAWTARGLLACADPERDALAFFDLTLAGMVSRKLYRVEASFDEVTLADHACTCVRIFLHGLGKPA
ncbi:TetR/AcrR family transcriptional regulator [Novosphingobium jiangmenense]|uniref:TetR/AcrR family transcriptional regulator n=1 Tax=Novosphingobium jiangmenense TaxID=2791981 RepID=A0ABS0HG05_9SPHN|nr:TetR/AcrR family transcriptional regulator [Novosphingobium jiangmenense]MBF9151207.1 TetR/AcrR family transcriptional regulator [Novosphingobium jiangmenense]